MATAAQREADRKLKEKEMRQAINQRLKESGERDKLKELLRQRLIECGWRDDMKAYCKQLIKERGLENINIDELVEEITPYGRSKIPEEIKKELLQRIRLFLSQQFQD